MATTTTASATPAAAHCRRKYTSPRRSNEGASTALRPSRSDRTPITGWATRPDTLITMR